MEASVTVFALAAGLMLAGAMVWIERRPRSGLSPGLLPTTPFLFVGLLIALLAAAHLLTLTGAASR